MSKPGDTWTSPGGEMQLRCGDWREVLADVVECDAVITDPPYSERTEKGVRSGSGENAARAAVGMGYDFITEEWCHLFADHWCSRCGWMFICGDHVTQRWHEAAAIQSSRYVFPPIPLVKNGAAPRMCADGPASQSEFCTVSRPKSGAFVGAWPGIRGWYKMETVRHGHGHGHVGVRGAKSVDFMRAIIKDYSRPGDLIVDPCAGGGTTLLAAAIEGRRAIGAEMDPETYDKAVARLSRGYTPSFLPLMEEK